PEERHGAAGRGELAAGHLQRRALPGAVRAEQRKHLAGFEAERDTVEDVDRAVRGVHVDELKHVFSCGLRGGVAVRRPSRDPGGVEDDLFEERYLITGQLFAVVAFTEVRGSHERVRLDLFRRAAGDDTA